VRRVVRSGLAAEANEHIHGKLDAEPTVEAGLCARRPLECGDRLGAALGDRDVGVTSLEKR